jgi:DNA-binding transcriptional LysR family regulator
MASAVRTHRPRVEVVSAGLDALWEEVARFDPHLVICSRPNTVDPGGRSAWFELPLDPERLAELCVDGQSFETANPALQELLEAIDETERLIRTKGQLSSC